MKPPVRMVCGDCLRSVELTADDAGRLPTLCPVCGGTIDSRLSEMETPTSNFTLPIACRRPAPTARQPLDRDLDQGLARHGRPVPAPRAAGRRRVRAGLPGVRPAARPRRRAEGLEAGRPRRAGDAAVLPRGPGRGPAVAPEHRRRSTTPAPTRAGAGSPTSSSTAGPCSRQSDQQKPDLVDAVRITRDLADALDHAHREGVFHRDLKPANVIIDGDGRPHLIDFGLARRADLDSDLTRDGAILGTPAYMSPEQAERPEPPGRRAERRLQPGRHALRAALRPTPGRDPRATSRPGRPSRPSPCPTPRSINRDVPVALEGSCMKALATDPQERYPNARAFADDLDALAQVAAGPAGSRPPAGLRRCGVAASCSCRRSPSLFAGPRPRRRGPPTPPPTRRTPVRSPTRPPARPGVRPRPLEAARRCTPDSALSGRTTGPVMHHARRAEQFHRRTARPHRQPSVARDPERREASDPGFEALQDARTPDRASSPGGVDRGSRS